MNGIMQAIPPKSRQYPNYIPSESSSAHSYTAVAVAPLHYQQHHYKQWADYYGQTDVSCAPGTENVTVSSTITLDCPIPGVTTGYPILNNRPPSLGTTSWRPESGSSELPLCGSVDFHFFTAFY
uniref:Uncharacterized protein n=1 Tax=Nelumbo nucifera TaxID=4432 RepID=A0A822Y5Q0_NELNU|nr:TPA_asm: hypothetical protein HUJ06_029255 [Nelumbo nucifera]